MDPEFAPLVRALELYVPLRGPGGAALSVHHRGQLVADIAIGTRDRAGAPMEPDTLVMCLSTAKGVTATLLHIVADRGELDLDAPVARYWPEFAQGGKGGITVSELVSHRAGLYAVRPLIDQIEDIYDWPRMVEALARAAPAHAPGRDFGYHAWTFGWLVGELLQRATGASFTDLLRECIAEPLGLEGLYIGLPEHERARVAQTIEWGSTKLGFSTPGGSGRLRRAAGASVEVAGRAARALGLRFDPSDMVGAMLPRGLSSLDLNSPVFLRAVIPSLNGVFDARSLSRLYAALAGGGELDGVRLMSRAAIERARADQNVGLGRVIPFPLRVKMGYHRPISLGLRVSVRGRSKDLGIASADAFGHFGLGGSGAWADPERELGVAVVTNCFAGRLPADLRTVGVCTAAAFAADRRAR
ncbi:Beta-lactamase precursor [Enhygromyxa salina]|uniref:Beta-lactamase n=1 Tax=Enhygromyxa salina TaxID=215803 RepID=A0A2S9XR70_9BACT|nr:serine hydrolase domain-containing protein [Enhygromyxa salina]PRP95368.1 Beta-lactamase precursor [Enhygromyxa salina]